MYRIYPECTVCSRTLSEEEKAYNEQHQLYHHPICETCVEQKTEQILQLKEEPNEK